VVGAVAAIGRRLLLARVRQRLTARDPRHLGSSFSARHGSSGATRTRTRATNRQRVASAWNLVYSQDPVTTSTPPTERVGRYQLLEPIGIGPSGAVSRAKVFGVAGFERQFAVKRFHSELTATAAMAAMLSAAARSYGSLEHPRIARMSEFGVAQGATFTAVEYVPGPHPLRLLLPPRPPPPPP